MPASPWLGVVAIVEGIVVLALAAVLLLRGRRRPAPVAFGIHFLAFAWILMLTAGFWLAEASVPPAVAVSALVAALVFSTSLLVFAVVYPHWAIRRQIAWRVAWCVIPGAMILSLFAFAPAVVVGEDGGPTASFVGMARVLLDASLAFSVVVFGRMYLRSRTADESRVAAYLLAIYFGYTLNHIVLDLAAFLGILSGVPRVTPLTALEGMAMVVAVAAVFGGIAWRRMKGGGAGRHDGAVLLAALIAIPLAFLQFQDGSLGPDSRLRHLVVDGVGGILQFYAVARHHLLDIDLAVKWTLRRGTVAAAFVAVFFVVATVASEFLTGTFGYALGGVAAGLLLFAIAPLQRVAERVADKAMPHVQDTAEYRVVRKHQVYRAAVASALSDGVITEKERDVLATLAQELGLGPKDALDLERAVATGARGVR